MTYHTLPIIIHMMMYAFAMFITSLHKHPDFLDMMNSNQVRSNFERKNKQSLILIAHQYSVAITIMLELMMSMIILLHGSQITEKPLTAWLWSPWLRLILRYSYDTNTLLPYKGPSQDSSSRGQRSQIPIVICDFSKLLFYSDSHTPFLSPVPSFFNCSHTPLFFGADALLPCASKLYFLPACPLFFQQITPVPATSNQDDVMSGSNTKEAMAI